MKELSADLRQWRDLDDADRVEDGVLACTLDCACSRYVSFLREEYDFSYDRDRTRSNMGRRLG